MPQEYTVAALAQWTGNFDKTVDQYGIFSKEASAELGLGLAKVLLRKYGVVNIVGGNGGGLGVRRRVGPMLSPHPLRLKFPAGI